MRTLSLRHVAVAAENFGPQTQKGLGGFMGHGLTVRAPADHDQSGQRRNLNVEEFKTVLEFIELSDPE